MENLHFLMSSGSADFAMIRENMAEVFDFEDDFSTSLKRGMVQYRMHRHSNVPSLVQNNSKNRLKYNRQSFFSMKKHCIKRYHPYLRMNKNEPQNSFALDMQNVSKIIGYQPDYDPKHLIEFLEKMSDSQDSVYETSSTDIDRLSFAFGEMSVFDDTRKAAVDEKEHLEQSNIPTVKICESELSEEKFVPCVKIYEAELTTYSSRASSPAAEEIPQEVSDMISQLRQEATENQRKRKMEKEARKEHEMITKKSRMADEKINGGRAMTGRKTLGRKMKIIKTETGRQVEWVGQKNTNDRGVSGKYNGQRKWFGHNNNRDRKMDGGKYNKGVKRQRNYVDDDHISASPFWKKSRKATSNTNRFH